MNASSSWNRNAPLQRDARIGRASSGVRAHEGADDRAAEVLAQVEGHVRHAQPMARRARGEHCVGRAARALGVWAVGVEPEAERHTDCVRERAQECDRAVDAAAHRHRRPAGVRIRAEHGTERVRERVDRKRLAADRGRLEQRQPRERPLEPGRVRLDDAVTVDCEPDGRPLAAAGGVSERLDHAVVGPDLGNLSKQVGALPPRRRTRAPFMVLLVHHSARTHR